MLYQDELIAHLTEYKRKHLGGPAAGTYRYRGREVLHEHILQPRDKWLNILEEASKTVRSFLLANPKVKKHKYFHHLNSSQAFALNLFVPYFEGGAEASTALLNALGQQAALVSWEAEAVPDDVEGTNLDAVWDTKDGVRTFCEVKLSERDFGKARLNERHLTKLRDIYLPRLAPYLDLDMQRAPRFFKSYQILRNVWHLTGASNGRLIFLIPRANAKLWPMLDGTLSLLSPVVRERVTAVAIEDVLESLRTNRQCSPHLRQYADKLKVKYIPVLRTT